MAVRCPYFPSSKPILPFILSTIFRSKKTNYLLNQCILTCLPPDNKPRQNLRVVELDIDIGADAKDWSAIQATEKLKPVEAELRRIEELTGEVVREMEYLRSREQTLRDTNESTNNRVKWFGVGTTWLLVILWAWQIMYLRAYFRSKHLI